jgi:hypothetical protein
MLESTVECVIAQHHTPSVLLVHPQQASVNVVVFASFPRTHRDHSFTNRIRSRRLRWTGEDPDAARGEDCVEHRGEPGVSVPEEAERGDPVAQLPSPG